LQALLRVLVDQGYSARPALLPPHPSLAAAHSIYISKMTRVYCERRYIDTQCSLSELCTPRDMLMLACQDIA
jgi:hypothetical protein